MLAEAVRVLSSLYTYIKLFHLLPGPRSLSQEGEARLDAGIKFETTYVDDAAKILPTEMFYEFIQDHFKRFPMKGIF